MNSKTTNEDSRFLPPTPDDFKRYSKHLAWLIDIKHNDSLELLSHIYGFSGFHEVASLYKQFRFEVTDPTPFFRTQENNRLLDLVAKAKGTDLSGLSTRCWDAREIGLFHQPHEHRTLFRRVRDTHLVLSSPVPQSFPDTEDYAFLDTTGGRARLIFTNLGQAVRDAAKVILDPDRHNIRDQNANLERLVQKHPNNPWLRSYWIENVGKILGNEFDDQWGKYLDRIENHQPKQIDASETIYQEAKTCIHQFKTLYGRQASKATNPEGFNPHADNWCWPTVLYYGGLAAKLTGRTSDCYQWWSLHFASNKDGYDVRGVRFELAQMRVNRGQGSLLNLFENRELNIGETGSIPFLTIAIHHFNKGNLQQASEFFTKGALTDPNVFTFFKKEEFSRFVFQAVYDESESSPDLATFLLSTTNYWRNNPEAGDYFCNLSTDNLETEVNSVQSEYENLPFQSDEPLKTMYHMLATGSNAT